MSASHLPLDSTDATPMLMPFVDWATETTELVRLASLGQMELAEAIVARHRPGQAHWVKPMIHDGLFVASFQGNYAMVSFLNPFADPTDEAAIARILAGGEHAMEQRSQPGQYKFGH